MNGWHLVNAHGQAIVPAAAFQAANPLKAVFAASQIKAAAENQQLLSLVRQQFFF